MFGFGMKGYGGGGKVWEGGLEIKGGGLGFGKNVERVG